MTQNNITDIEKCARLIFGDFGKQMIEAGFNPRTNKADLSDVIDELGIDVAWDRKRQDVIASKEDCNCFSAYKYINDDAKFAARAKAVIAVAVQIYDAKYGKDGE